MVYNRKVSVYSQLLRREKKGVEKEEQSYIQNATLSLILETEIGHRIDSKIESSNSFNQRKLFKIIFHIIF